MTSKSTVKFHPIPKNGVSYLNKVVLAPMVRSGELPMRLLSLKHGADLVWGPETVDRAMIGTTRRINPRTSTVDFTRLPSNSHKKNLPPKESLVYRLHPELEKGKLIFQLGSAKPELAVQAAKLVAGDVAGIDLNAGCPKSFSTDGGMGAELLKDPERLVSILEALVREVGSPFEIGISVKIRILPSPEKTEELVKKLVKTGISGLTVHCREPAMRKTERVKRDQVQMIVDICHEAGIPCLLNGDITSMDQGRALAAEYGTDGAMIALAAESNPSCFRTAEQGGLLPWKEVVEEFLVTAMKVENKFGNTKHQLGLLMKGSDPSYRKMTQSRSYRAFCEALELEKYMDMAREVDERSGILEMEQMEEKKKAEQEAARQQREKNKTNKQNARGNQNSQRGKRKREVKDDGVVRTPVPPSVTTV
ncbi:MAG: hypothetical protein M1834_007184 [Cirrosporium novae-zelandiae]|nr:MAG: hypothetical protein M1834_007184 [Cirrosporium novae-zelandiae]